MCSRSCRTASQTLSTVSKNVPLLVGAGAHTSIISCINKHPACLPLQKISLATLSNLALHRSTGQPLIEANAHLVVLSLLERFDDAGLLECAATCMANLANSRAKGTRMELIRRDVHKLCMRYAMLLQGCLVPLCITRLSSARAFFPPIPAACWTHRPHWS